MIAGARRASGRTLRAATLVLALALGVGGVVPVRAGGPLDLYNHQAVVYPSGGTALKLNIDQGPFGTRTNAQAVALVQSAIGLWNGVPTSTVRLALGTTLTRDYTSANYSTVFNSFSDGLNPVIFDTDGSITDAIFGANAKTYILGFAGSAYRTTAPQPGTYVEGRSVLNGAINVTDATWTVVLAHEFGHFFGLDHTQLDATQGLASSNYALMYPIAYRTLLSLHEDDKAAVTALYPAAGAASAYGQLTGTFTTAAGTPILGANIWVNEVSTGKVYSVVSDFLMQGNGYFRLYLPAGSYALHAESIDARFVGGSSVGPYSNVANDASFQAPHPIAPVTLGGASPRQVAIVAGCVATATLKLDGTGNVTGNCGPLPAATTTLASSVNPSIVGGSVTFTAQVTGAAPTGTVTFRDNGVAITGCSAVALAGGGNSPVAQCATSSLAAGTHPVTATYGGDANNAGSAGNLPQVVNPGSMTVTVTGTVTVLPPPGTRNSGASCTTTTGSNARSFDAATGICSITYTYEVTP